MVSYNISNEFQFKPYLNGVKLLKPQAHHSSDYTYSTVENILLLDLNIYFLSIDGKIKKTNETTANRAGYLTVEEAYDKTVFDMYTDTSAEAIFNADNQVIANKRTLLFEDECLRSDGKFMQYLSVKSPWFDENNKCIGLFGASILFGEDSLAAALMQIIQLGLLLPAHKLDAAKFFKKNTIDNIYFSKRELECLSGIVRGKSSKFIAGELGLSPRTVEHYIDNIKNKANCHSKYELIFKYANYFL